MKPTIDLQCAIGNRKSFLPQVSSIAFETIAVKELLPPENLFDEKIPPAPAAALDALIPIIAAKNKEQGLYTIVDGCKRVTKMLETNQNTCVCGIFTDILDAKAIGLMRIYLNKSRDLSMREKICFYKWLNKNCAGNDFEEIAELLGFSSSLRRELRPLLECRDNVLDAIAGNRLSVRLVPDFCLMEERDREAFLEAFCDLQLSLQTQHEFLEWLPEIACARKTTVSGLLQSEDIQKIIHDKNPNGPQKIEAIREILHSYKFPRYSEAMEKWKKLAASTGRTVLENEPSSKIVFVPSQAFEMNRLEMRISISRAPAAKEIFQKLSDVPQSTWAQLMYPIAIAETA